MDISEAVSFGLVTLQELIKIDTTAGAKRETLAAQFLLKQAEQIGISTRLVEPHSGMGSIISVLPGKTDESLLLLSHLDTAPPGARSEWKYAPFSGERVNVEIWGRGAIDCKGLAAAWWAVLFLLKDYPLAKGIVMVAASGEELQSEWGARWIRDNCPEIRTCRAALNEGGGWSIRLGSKSFVTCQTGEKGFLKLRLPKRIRTNTPDTLLISAPLPESCKRFLQLAGGTSGLIAGLTGSAGGRLLTQWLQKSSPYGVDPAEMFYHVCRSTANQDYQEWTCSVLPGASATEIVGKIAKRMNVHPSEIQVIEQIEPSESSLENELFSLIKQSHKAAVLPIITPGRSDSVWFRQLGIPVYGWFPGVEASQTIRMHRPNERISVASFQAAVHSLFHLVKAYTGS